jgi:phage-related protein
MAGNRVIIRFLGEDRDLGNALDRLQQKANDAGIGFKSLGITAAVALAAPAAAGLALAGLPLLFGGIGIAAVASNEKVKSSFTSLADHVKTEAAKLAAPFVPVLTNISDQFRTTFDAIAPLLGRAFAAAAPMVQTLADGVRGFVTNAMPLFTQALEVAKPIIDTLSTGLAGMGTAIGLFFTNISTATPGATSGLKSLFDIINGLLPTLGTLIANLTNFFAPILRTVADLLGGFFGWLNDIGPAIGPIVAGVLAFAAAFKILQLGIAAYNAIMAIVPAVTAIATAAQWLWNAAMDANPIGIIILVIAGLVAAIILCYNKIGWFKDGVDAVWSFIKSAFQVGVDVVKNILNWFAGLPALFSGWINGAKNAIVNGFNAAVAWVRGIPGMILGALGNLGGLLLGAGKAIIDGFLNGLKAAWNAVTGFIGGIGDWISSHKGPISFDMKLLIPHGNAIMDGLLGGLSDGNRRVQSFVGGIASGIAGVMGDGFSTNLNANMVGGMTGGNAAASGASGSGQNINFSGNVDSAFATAFMRLVREGSIQIG